jgi:hypothetical protein
MSRRSNGDGVDGTSSSSVGLINNPLASSSSTIGNEEKKNDNGPLEHTSGDTTTLPEANPAEEEAMSSSSSHPLNADDPVMSSASITLASTRNSSELHISQQHASSSLMNATADPTTTSKGPISASPTIGTVNEALTSSTRNNNDHQSDSFSQRKRQHPHSYNNNGDDESCDTLFAEDDEDGGTMTLQQRQHRQQLQQPSSSVSAADDHGDDDAPTNPGIVAKRISSSGSNYATVEDDPEGTDQEVPVSNHYENNNSVTWKPQDKQSVCEFTHTIMDYSSKRDSGCKKAEYSDITVDDCGNKWRLIVYVNGNGRASNHHLSLFLQVRDHGDLITPRSLGSSKLSVHRIIRSHLVLKNGTSRVYRL